MRRALLAVLILTLTPVALTCAGCIWLAIPSLAYQLSSQQKDPGAESANKPSDPQSNRTRSKPSDTDVE